ncbi:C40 family peptidase [bacterium]|nr:MAG: C40 family peptidase [bacterium]
MIMKIHKIFIKVLLLNLIFAITYTTNSLFGMSFNSRRTYRSTSPCTRLYFGKTPKLRALPDNFYFDTFLGKDPVYQIGQLLYGEEFTAQALSENEIFLKGSSGTGGVISPANLQRIAAPINQQNHGTLEVVVSDVHASCMNQGFREVLQLPMGSTLFVEDGNNPQYFQFIHPEGAFQTMLLISKNSVTEINKLKQLDEHSLRSMAVSQAEKLLGIPFQWGGQSAFERCGFDCAGLIHTAYRSCAKIISRDVAALFRKTAEIDSSNLQPGDLVFAGQPIGLNKNDVRIDHVLLYAGNDELIEASPQTGLCEKTTCTKLFGKSINLLKNGDVVPAFDEEYLIFFRSIF